MFFGNLSDPPPVGSTDKVSYNLTTTHTYISISASGSVAGTAARPGGGEPPTQRGPRLQLEPRHRQPVAGLSIRG
jgi:hypothetical protein